MTDSSRDDKPPVSPAAPKTFIERRKGLPDRRRRGVPDRRTGTPDRRNALVPEEMTGHNGAPESFSQARQTAPKRSDGPFVVDATDVDKTHRVFHVQPDVFMDIVDRLDLSMIIHHKKRNGMNTYYMEFSGVVVETQTPNRLSLLDASEHEMEHPVVMPRSGESSQKSMSQPEPQAVKRPSKPQVRPIHKERVMAHKKQPLMEFFTEEGYYVTEWWNSPDDPALSVARIRIESGTTTSSYELHGITERYLFLTGHGIVEVDDRIYEVGPGDGMLVKAGAKRRITNRGERDMGFLAICRPRFSRLSDEPMQNKFVKVR